MGSVTFPAMNIYGMTGMGAKVKIGSMPTTVIEGLNYVGGKIYYIDSTADGQYEFFNRNGDLMDEVNVGDEPYAYRVVNAGTKDKYYVYYDEMYTSKRWTYYKDGAYVYNSIGGLGQEIGKGKTNTAKMMLEDDGAYVTNDSNGQATIWYQLQQVRNAKAGGCDDWFVPSRYEIEELRKAIGFKVVTTSDDPVVLTAGAVTGGSIAGVADGVAHYKDYNSTRTCYPSATKFINNYIWSSSEYSAQYSWYWDYGNQYWYVNGKNYNFSVLFARAF